LGGWRPDDRVLITDVSSVTALARGPNRLFAATLGGLLAYDDAFGRFELPLTVEDGYPVAPVTAMVWDARDGTLWLAAGRELVQADPRSRRFVDRFTIRDPVASLVPAEVQSNDLFARTPSGWRRIDTFSRAERGASPAEVEAAVDRNSDLRARKEILEDPFFGDMVPLITRQFDGSRARVTDVIPAFRPGAYWIATDGAFVILYNHMARSWERLAYGFRGSGVAAVAGGKGGLWFAPRAREAGGFGVARVGADLQSWQMWNADSARSVPGGGLRAMEISGAFVWVGGESGLFRYLHGAGEWQESRGAVPAGTLPILSLAADPWGEDSRELWLGTARGLYRLRATTLASEALLPTETILALLGTGDALWVGTRNGLYAVRAGEGGGILGVGRVEGPNALMRPSGALAGAGDTVYAGLGNEVWRGGSDSEWERVDAIGPLGGPVTALAVYNGVVWAGSAEGVVVWDTDGGRVRRLSYAAGDLPPDRYGGRGVARILAVDRDEAWLATPAGALWIREAF
jgi:hypothetical protein